MSKDNSFFPMFNKDIAEKITLNGKQHLRELENDMNKEEIKKAHQKQLDEINHPKHETFTLDEMLHIAQFGFDMAKESSETYVPVGNMLQHLMSKRDLILVPTAWREFRNKIAEEYIKENKENKDKD